MQVRPFIYAAIAAALAFGIYATTQTQDTVLRVAVPNEGEPSTDRFVEVLVSKAAEQGVKIEPVRDRVGSYGDLVKQMRDGKSDVDLALVPVRSLPDLDSDAKLTYTSLITQPGVIASSAENVEVQDSSIGQAVARELGETGLSVVGFWNRPAAAIVARGRLTGAGGLKGLKVVSRNPASVKVLTDLGASPVEIPVTELQSALLAGTVDAVEGIATSIVSLKLLDLGQDATLIDNFMQNPGLIVANRASWADRPDKTRSIVEAAAREARSAGQAVVLEAEKNLEKLTTDGGAVYVSSGADGWTDIREAAASNWLESDTGTTRGDAYAELEKVRE